MTERRLLKWRFDESFKYKELRCCERRYFCCPVTESVLVTIGCKDSRTRNKTKHQREISNIVVDLFCHERVSHSSLSIDYLSRCPNYYKPLLFCSSEQMSRQGERESICIREQNSKGKEERTAVFSPKVSCDDVSLLLVSLTQRCRFILMQMITLYCGQNPFWHSTDTRRNPSICS